MLISTALLLDSNIRNSVCTPAQLPCRRVVEGDKIRVDLKDYLVFYVPENLLKIITD
jgi:predicted nucleotidyltransferase